MIFNIEKILNFCYMSCLWVCAVCDVVKFVDE